MGCRGGELLANMGVHGVNCMTGGEGRDLAACLEYNNSRWALEGGSGARWDGLGWVSVEMPCCGFLFRFDFSLFRFSLNLEYFGCGSLCFEDSFTGFGFGFCLEGLFLGFGSLSATFGLLSGFPPTSSKISRTPR